MTDYTKRLYFENPYQMEFEARVIQRTTIDKKPTLVLDQTCFYPKSGGQPSDKGWINGITVLKVSEEGDQILHMLEGDVTSDEIKGRVDWETRFDHMQQHSGQHILSQSFFGLFKAETLSFHLGVDTSSVEIGLREISEEEVEEVERRANEVVFQDREIRINIISEEKIDSIPLRRPPKKRGAIRVVEVKDFDYSACGGTHVRRAGEIGLVKILKWERIRDNIRFEFVCGQRAFKDYAWKTKNLRELSIRLTAHEREVISSVEKLFSDLKSKKMENKKLRKRIFQYQAKELIQKASGKIVRDVFLEKTPEEMKYLALNIIRQGDFIVLFGLKREGRAYLIFACSENVNIDMRELLPLVNPLVKGRGGGSPSLVEIGGESHENLELALQKVSEFVGVRLSKFK